MKTGLVLEGGAMRGIYTAGVLDVFTEQGLHFDRSDRSVCRGTPWLFFRFGTEGQKHPLF